LAAEAVPSKAWEYGDYGTGTSILETADGGYLAAGADDGGYSEGNFMNSTVSDWVARISQNGTMLWSKTYNITESLPVGVTIGRAVDGGYLVSGKLGVVRIDDEGIVSAVILVSEGGYVFVGIRRTYLWIGKIDEPLSARPSLKPFPTVAQTSMPNVTVTPTMSPAYTLIVASPSPLPSSIMPALPSPSLPRADTADSVLSVDWVYGAGVGLAAITVAIVACAVWRFRKKRGLPATVLC
jgi:hypothetical protein